MKLQVTEFVSLDGVIENPHLWSFDFWNDEIAFGADLLPLRLDCGAPESIPARLDVDSQAA